MSYLDWMPSSQDDNQATEVYEYTDEAGRLLFGVSRNASKEFRQWRPDPLKSAGRRWSLKDDDGAMVRLVLYRLPRVLAAVAAGRTVFVCEGEKDVHALEAAGLVATCNPMGAGKWDPAYAETLRGASVIVVTDRDAAGWAHARTVEASLQGVARTVLLACAREGKDAADHLAAGHAPSEFAVIDPAAPPDWASADGHEPAPPGIDLLARMKDGAYLNTAVFAPLHYHVPGLVPEGLTVLTGAPKIGKSWLVLGWLLELATAGHAVLYLALEDSDRRMQWRCRRLLGAAPVPAAFCYLTEDDVRTGLLLPTVAEFVRRHHDRAPLVVVDTLAKALEQTPRIRDEAQYERDYRVASMLQFLVRGCPGAGLVVCHHDRKSGGEDWIDRTSGTKGLTGAPDALMYLERKRGEEAGALHVTGRDIAEADYAMVFRDKCRWGLDGATLQEAAGAYLARQAAAGLGDRSARIVAFVAEAGSAGVRRDDVAAEFGLAPETASLYLNRLATSGRIARPTRGLYTCVSSVSSSQASPYIDTEDTHTHRAPEAPPAVYAPYIAPAPPPVTLPGAGASPGRGQDLPAPVAAPNGHDLTTSEGLAAATAALMDQINRDYGRE